MRGVTFFSMAAIAFLSMFLAACDDRRSPYDEFTADEQYILRGLCDPDCSFRQIEFTAFSPVVHFRADAFQVHIEPSDPAGFEYCISYFDDQSCGTSPLNWNQISAARLSFPCSTHPEGFLIELRRGEVTEGGGFAHPSYWLAYADGEVAATEGETSEALGSMFVCSGE